jgi:PQQ-like domain
VPLSRLISIAAVVSGAFCPARADDKPSYRVLAADKGHVAIVNAKGEVDWEVPNKHEVHDVTLLANGNILMPTAPNTVVEMTPEKKIVWEYAAKPKAGYKGRIEIHACQRLDDGRTMVAESGNARIVEVDKEGKVVHEVALTVEHPNAHRDTRMARKLANGHYLVCHEGDGKVREYDPDGKVVWTYTLDLGGRPRSDGHGPEGHGTEIFGAVRLPNGNTLIACGNGNRVIEVTTDGKIVWELKQDELPGIKLAWVTTLQVKENGNVIVGNCHAGPDYPQLFEVTREKQVVWTFKDFKTFGNALAASQVLGIDGKVIR